MEPPNQNIDVNDLLSRLEPGDIPDSPTADIISANPDLTTEEHTDPADGITEDPSSISTEETSSQTLEEGLPKDFGSWTRRPEETTKAYDAFCVYRDLGSGRSLNGAYCKEKGRQKGVKRASGHWNRWYRQNNWKSRAEAYDHHLDDIKRQAEAQKWKKRGRDLVDAQYETYEAMLAKGQQMLQFPLARQTVEQRDEQGHPTHVTVEPARWNMNSAVHLIKAAFELGRLASGLPTKNERSTTLNIDVTKLTDEQLDRIAHGEDPAIVLATSDHGRSNHDGSATAG